MNAANINGPIHITREVAENLRMACRSSSIVILQIEEGEPSEVKVISAGATRLWQRRSRRTGERIVRAIKSGKIEFN